MCAVVGGMVILTALLLVVGGKYKENYTVILAFKRRPRCPHCDRPLSVDTFVDPQETVVGKRTEKEEKGD